MSAETPSYAFDTGRALTQCPEGQTLYDVYSPITEQVLGVLETEQVVIVSGESGLGKTEIFLNYAKIPDNGGLVERLEETGRPFSRIDFQSGSSNHRVDTILGSNPLPEIVVIDEAGLICLKQDCKDALGRLLAYQTPDGRKIKVVLIGGGSINANEGNERISHALTTIGYDTRPSQRLTFPAVLFNDTQIAQLLRRRDPDIPVDRIRAVLDHIDELEVPRLPRVALNLNSLADDTTKMTYSNFITHIVNTNPTVAKD